MRYWTRCIHIKYEIGKRLDKQLINLAYKMPSRLRMWVVVASANEAIFNVHPRPDGYCGPDGLDFQQIMDGASRKVV